MINKISPTPGVGFETQTDDSRRFDSIREVDKKHTEATRYYKEIGKTPEEVKKEREKMMKRGEAAFLEVLRGKMG